MGHRWCQRSRPRFARHAGVRPAACPRPKCDTPTDFRDTRRILRRDAPPRSPAGLSARRADNRVSRRPRPSKPHAIDVGCSGHARFAPSAPVERPRGTRQGTWKVPHPADGGVSCILARRWSLAHHRNIFNRPAARRDLCRQPGSGRRCEPPLRRCRAGRGRRGTASRRSARAQAAAQPLASARERGVDAGFGAWRRAQMRAASRPRLPGPSSPARPAPARCGSSARVAPAAPRKPR